MRHRAAAHACNCRLACLVCHGVPLNPKAGSEADRLATYSVVRVVVNGVELREETR